MNKNLIHTLGMFVVAWVLWEHTYGIDGSQKYQSGPWKIVSAWDNFDTCMKTKVDMVNKNLDNPKNKPQRFHSLDGTGLISVEQTDGGTLYFLYKCLPDTILDPRDINEVK